MCTKLVAVCVMLALPAAASAESGRLVASGPGPLKQAAQEAGKRLAAAQQHEGETRSRTRFWTGVGLLAAGGALAALSAVELGDDDQGPDDAEDFDNSDDGEDSDGWGNKALLGGGIAAASIGGVLLLTQPRRGPVVSVRPGRIAVRHTIRF